MSDPCDHNPESQACCHTEQRIDWLLWGSLVVVTGAFAVHLFGKTNLHGIPFIGVFAHGVFELMNRMWWGLLSGVVAVSIINQIPRQFVMGVLGQSGGLKSILRATAAGLTLDLCNHGILLVGMQLYKRGASLGQTMAFLIASPWNSLSVTIILISLIGLQWTLLFVGLSGVIAIASGLIFDVLVSKNYLPNNPNSHELPQDFRFFQEARKSWASTNINPSWITSMFREGLAESRMILRWIFFGIVLAALVRALIPNNDIFAGWFGASISGLLLTLVAATVIEVCSEGSSPIASELVNRGGAPGNGFTFLMSGAATDYTEIMSLRETTVSWKIPLMLPAITVPQVLIAGYLLNTISQ